jgi:hypothetical protein
VTPFNEAQVRGFPAGIVSILAESTPPTPPQSRHLPQAQLGRSGLSNPADAWRSTALAPAR